MKTMVVTINGIDRICEYDIEKNKFPKFYCAKKDDRKNYAKLNQLLKTTPFIPPMDKVNNG